jgi:superfamily II DNA or RNA helicase
MRSWKPALRRPVIYAFRIPSRPCDIKVGETSKPVTQRIPEYLKAYGYDPDDYELLAEIPAISGEGLLKDHDIHKVLEHHLGCHRYPGEEREWFKATIVNLKRAIRIIIDREQLTEVRHQTFGMRPEQQAAVDKAAGYFRRQNTQDGKAHFLWNAKMRFGKTFTTYKLAQEMGWSKVMVLTYKPAVEDSWRKDLESHKDFEDWTFIGNREGDPEFGQKTIWFSSFQALFSEEGNGRLAKVFETDWDAIVIDEFHYGASSDLASDILRDDVEGLSALEQQERVASGEAGLKTNRYLHLSGTPFKALHRGEFTEDQIFNWTYTDEQRAKAAWSDPEVDNPYAALPRMVMMTYKLPEGVVEEAGDELNLDTFFKAGITDELDEYGKPLHAFENEDQVKLWVDFITGTGLSRDEFLEEERNRSPMPYKDAGLFPYINHSLWYMPSVSACKAMADILRKHHVLSNYDVVVAAGQEAGIGINALAPVRDVIQNNFKTITLSCGKLTTGVTVPEWTAVFMLRSMKSPESYFQTAFRAQSPGTVLIQKDKRGKDVEGALKDTCYVFDFDPRRALTLASEYCYKLDQASAEGETDRNDLMSRMSEFLEYMPVLCHDNGVMIELDPGAAIELATSGIGTAMLARRFQSPKMVDLTVLALNRLRKDEELVGALEKIESFRNLAADLDTIRSEQVKKGHVPKEGQEGRDEKEKAEKKPDPLAAETKKKLKEIRDNLLKFVTRLPVFMYLNDEREKTAIEVIETTDDRLFKKVTGITKADFRKLLDLGVFQAEFMNEAIRTFKRVEDNALEYLGDREITGGYVAAWDAHVERV